MSFLLGWPIPNYQFELSLLAFPSEVNDDLVAWLVIEDDLSKGVQILGRFVIDSYDEIVSHETRFVRRAILDRFHDEDANDLIVLDLSVHRRADETLAGGFVILGRFVCLK
jgi:hypothetical protein